MDYNKLPREEGKYIKLGNGKVEHTETLLNGTPNYTYTLTHNLYAKVVDMQNKVLCEEIISFAKEQGVTDLFLIDEDFVKSALIHEKNLRSPLYQKGVVKKPPTNFDRITESVEALAEYIYQVTSCCPFELKGVVAPCTIPLSNKGCTNCIKEWLQKECEG